MSGILVSIDCTTYNHGKYISDALDSFLMQNTNFKYEILVHDDASTDDTPKIIKEYESIYPDLIKPIYQKENQYSKGLRVSGINLRRARGKYIAVCEGDDYWIDPYKLQKQVDYMESHPECSMCTHAAYIVSEDKKITGKVRPANTSRTFSVEDIILGGGGFIATNSMLYRSIYQKEIPEFYHNAPVGDYPLAIFLSLKGTVYYMDQFMSSYRKGIEGSWTWEYEINYTLDELSKFTYGMVRMLDEIDGYSNYAYHDLIDKRKIDFEFSLIDAQNDFKKMKEPKFLEKYKSLPPVSRLKIVLRHRAPWLVRVVKDLRSLVRNAYRNE